MCDPFGHLQSSTAGPSRFVGKEVQVLRVPRFEKVATGLGKLTCELVLSDCFILTVIDHAMFWLREFMLVSVVIVFQLIYQQIVRPLALSLRTRSVVCV